MNSEPITLSRDVNAIVIPDGNHTTLKQGDSVTIHQTLGNNYTVITTAGMARIAGCDADSLGLILPVAEIATGEDKTLEERCWNVLKTIYDPEIPVNIVDLGLIYNCDIAPQGECFEVKIQMTLTAPGCGMGPIIQGDVERCLKDLQQVSQVDVEVVLDPPWSREMMSEVARIQLGLF